MSADAIELNELNRIRQDLATLHRLLDLHRANAAIRHQPWAVTDVDELEHVLSEVRAQLETIDGQLVCVECGATSDPGAAGWRTYLTDDDQPAHYCPDCAGREFGDGGEG